MKIFNLFFSVIVVSHLSIHAAFALDAPATTSSVSYDQADFPTTAEVPQIKLKSASLSVSHLKSVFRGNLNYAISKLCSDCSNVAVRVISKYPASIKPLGNSKSILDRKFLVTATDTGGLNLAETPGIGRTLFRIPATYSKIPVQVELSYVKNKKSVVSKVNTSVDLFGILQ